MAAFPTTYHMLINGEAVAAPKTFSVTNPATGKPFAECPDCTPEQVDQAVDAAEAALPEWAATPLETRRALVAKCGEVLAPHAAKLAELVSLEQGKPKGGETPERAQLGASGEVAWMLALFAKAATTEVAEQVWHETDTHVVKIVRRPIGVVAGIAPWNFPLLTLFMKLIPAVTYGNTFVAKPSPFTPLATLAAFELIKDVLPKGVVNCVVSDDAVFRSGAHLTAHPKVAKVSFTGSVPTGQRIYNACSSDVKRITLELGGNDASIVLPDVDIKETAEKVFRGAFSNTGQICVAIKRLFVHENIFDEFVAELTRLAKEAKVGDGLAPDTDYGPLNNEMQLKIVSELVEDAKQHGAKIHCGGKRMDRDGFFYEPTILTDVAEGVRIVDQEQFGPALPVLKYSDPMDALARANRTRFGLGASVFGKDVEKANDLAAQLVAGTVWVNEHLGSTNGAPFGGMKLSGLGREGGPADLGTWTETTTFKQAKKP